MSIASDQFESAVIEAYLPKIPPHKLEAARKELDIARSAWKQHHDDLLKQSQVTIEFEEELKRAIERAEAKSSQKLGATAEALMLEINSFEEDIKTKRGKLPPWMRQLRGYLTNLVPILSVPIRVISAYLISSNCSLISRGHHLLLLPSKRPQTGYQLFCRYCHCVYLP